MPEGFSDSVRADPDVGAVLVGRVATLPLVRTLGSGGEVVDEVRPGWHLPVEVIAFDPAEHRAAFDQPMLSGLAPDEAVLSETSARIRRLGAGSRLVFEDGVELEVVDVIPDRWVGGGEVIVGSDSLLTVTRERFLLTRPAEPGADLEPALRSHVPSDLRATVARPGDTPILRHADAVLSPARVKELFGEFSMREAAGRSIEQDPAWVDEHIASGRVPILGQITCHREVLPAVRGALEQVVDEGLRSAVDPADYAGCWSPRTQAVGEPLSHHSWGIAIDLNAAANPFGGESTQHPRLVEIMRAWGFTWGDPWLIADPMHFEAGHHWGTRPAN
ncbi:MAG: M15 family metallopeptidase [Nitriliruptorales bacterium]|nr:M15 family metallopeptidase [Nitriliruptorales bacterium]